MSDDYWTFYQENWDAINRYFRRNGCNEIDAEAQATEVFERFRRAQVENAAIPSQWQPHKGSRAYLFQIARNLAIDSARRQVRTVMSSLTKLSTDVKDAATTDPESHVVGLLSDNELHRCIERLPEPYRNAILLRYYSDETYTEDDLGELLNVTRNRAHQILRTARAQLKRCLDG